MSQIGTFTAYGDVPARIGVQAVATALAHAEVKLLVSKFPKEFPFKKNSGLVIRFRRLKPFGVTTQPLTEGVAPAPTQVEQELIDFRIKQYGAQYKVSDWVTDMHEDPILDDIYTLAGEQAAVTRELVLWGYMRAGTQVIYAGGEASRADVATPINIDAISAAINELERNFATPMTDMIRPGVNIGTEPIGHGFIGFGHVDQRFDFEEMDTFVPYYRYGSANNLRVTSPYEIGAVRGSVRIFLAPHLVYFPNSGAEVGVGDPAEGMRSDNGVNANVYPFVIVGKDSFGAMSFRGRESAEMSVRPPRMGTPGDDLGQQGVVAWKFWYTGGILNQRWIVRIESTASELVAVV